MVRMAKQAAPIERLTKFADHIREHDVEAEKFGFQVQEASEFFKLYPKRKSPVKNQPDGVGFFRNERKEIFVLYKPRLHRVRRPTEVLNKMGQGWRQFKFTRKEQGDRDFDMFFKYSKDLIPGRAEAQTFSSLLLVYYRNLNNKGEYEASESESEEGGNHIYNNNPQVVPSAYYYSPSASSASPVSSPASSASSMGHSPSSFSPSLSPVPMAAFAPPQFHSFQFQHQNYLSPYTLPTHSSHSSHSASRSASVAATIAPSMDMMNMINMTNNNYHQQHHQQQHNHQHNQSLPEISITGPVEEYSTSNFEGFSKPEEQELTSISSASTSSSEEEERSCYQPQVEEDSFGSHEFIGFDFEDFNGSGLMIEEIEDYSHISFV